MSWGALSKDGMSLLKISELGLSERAKASKSSGRGVARVVERPVRTTRHAHRWARTECIVRAITVTVQGWASSENLEAEASLKPL